MLQRVIGFVKTANTPGLRAVVAGIGAVACCIASALLFNGGDRVGGTLLLAAGAAGMFNALIGGRP